MRTLPVRQRRRRELAGEIARYLGAVSILLVGAVHAQQYYDAYFSVVPTIGTLSCSASSAPRSQASSWSHPSACSAGASAT
jgi:hypothetical protein